jgi:hypothetical protein
MKITINVDCTPEEARAAMGLPDVTPMNDAMIRQMTQRMEQVLSSADPETLLKTWIPAATQGFEQWQKMFWGQINAAMTTHADKMKKP